MAIMFKCKMCGGSIEFEPGATVGVCDSCGTRQTLPRLDDEKRVNLYDRANHYRRNNQFDKAMGIYEQILDEDRTDAEAYWSLVLCSYGISYVEDPATRRRVPTLNRMQRTSIYNDENYKAALHYADAAQKQLYEAEAQVIAQIQKGYSDVALNEKPFDIFICYKETDAAGNRTPDSVLAEELYNNLTKEGYKVFFSRITLEDKLGEAYEPYIYAALNSAQVMVVVGTSPENFNAVWVKNEWSRYLALIRNGESKTLIPAYRGMDPYDLPMEFSDKQGQDMSKIGCMQDLVRGIKKIAPLEAVAVPGKANQTVAKTSVTTDSLLERVSIFLNDGEWERADEYCEKVLDIDPQNGQAYLGKLLASHEARSLSEVPKQVFYDAEEFDKVLMYGDDDLKKEVQELIEKTQDEVISNLAQEAVKELREQTERENKAKDNKYNQAKLLIDKAEEFESWGTAYGYGQVLGNCSKAIGLFRQIPQWKDADSLVVECQRRIDSVRIKHRDASYNEANAQMRDAYILIENGKIYGGVCDIKSGDVDSSCVGSVDLDSCIHAGQWEEMYSAYIPDETYDEIRAVLIDLLDASSDGQAGRASLYFDEAAFYLVSAGADFNQLCQFKDSEALSKRCFDGLDDCRRDALYTDAIAVMNSDEASGCPPYYEAAIRGFDYLQGWRDSANLLKACQKGLKAAKARYNAKLKVEKQKDKVKRKVGKIKSAFTDPPRWKRIILKIVVGWTLICLVSELLQTIVRVLA